MSKRTKKRKSKKSTSVFGALVFELVGIALFLFLFTQARAERQAAAQSAPTFPIVQGMFEQTPFQSVFGR